MTHQSHQTNGASLEDCHTNFFALTELCGIKWRKFVWGEGGRAGPGGGPLEDPVIGSYARCLASDILCVWRRVPAAPPPPPAHDVFDTAPAPPPPPPPLSLRAAKELWIFWYGEEPDINSLIPRELIDSCGDSGSWENGGLSYECRSLLFKALHNLIERCLLSRDFIRLGKWFVQPYDGDEDDVGKSCWHLSFSFAFFLHESNVCASVDVRQHPPVRTLTAQRLAKLSSQHNSTEDAPASQAKVILAPFGLDGVLTGQTFNSSDPSTARLLDSWRHFYPVSGENDMNGNVSTVEVMVGGVRMRYPSRYVLLTDMDPLATTVSNSCSPDTGAHPQSQYLPAKLAEVMAERTYRGMCNQTPQPNEPCNGEAQSDKMDWDFVDCNRKTICNCSKWWRRSSGRRGERSSQRRVAPFHRRSAPPRPHHRLQAGSGTPGGGCSPGSCGAPSPAPPCSAPPSVNAAPAPSPSPHHQTLQGGQPTTPRSSAQQIPMLHTPAPTPDPNAPPTPRTPRDHYNQTTAESPAAATGGTAASGGEGGGAELLKRPVLATRERAPHPTDDEHTLHMLYDYTTMHAWLDHPVKRFKSEDPFYHWGDEMTIGGGNCGAVGGTGSGDLYSGHNHIKMAPILDRNFMNDIKQEPNDDSNKDLKSLYTSNGLLASYRDLDQIFDNSDDAASGDETLQVHTPPDSNKSVAMCVGEERPRVRPEELCKMFPTPPSMEAHAQPSPGAPGHPDAMMTDVMMMSPRAASPHDEPIEDWSYVFKPPTICKYVGSSKYAPLANLPSQLLPPVTLPTQSVYRPRWGSNSGQEVQQVNQTIKQEPRSVPPPSPSIKQEPRTSLQQPPTPHQHHQQLSNLHSTGTISAPPSVGVASASPALVRAAPPYTASPPSPASSCSGAPPPQACALLLNLLLTDTVLNIFRDHNFDSCTLCVCGDGPKGVGNIRGADASVYLPGGGAGSPSSPGRSPPPAAELEDSFRCSCGFSAVVNRRLAHRAGLFYEDEMEITGLAEDPAEYKKTDSSGPALGPVLELIREHCTGVSSTANALARAARELVSASIADEMRVNLLEYTDGSDAASLALEAAAAGGAAPRTPPMHRWPFIGARGPRSSRDVVRVMLRLQPLLQDAIQKKCSTRLWDAVTGPLTWRQFHRLAGRGTNDVCEPQPVPPLLVGHDRDWISLSPYALHYWDKLALEPYSYARDAAYLVVAPEGEALTDPLRTFFRELSTAYEMCRLGRHTPLGRVAPDGLVRVGRTTATGEEEWAPEATPGRAGELVRAYANTLRSVLVPQLATLQLDRSLLEQESRGVAPPPASPMPPPPSTPDHPPTPNSQSDQESDSTANTASAPTTTGNTTAPWSEATDEESGTPMLVLYLVEPTGAADEAERRAACLALLRCAAQLLAALPVHLRHYICPKIISLEAIGDTSGWQSARSRGHELRALAFSVFTQSRRLLQHQPNIKSLTGFGTAANADLFLKSKDEKNRGPYKLYSPAYVLAPPKAVKDVVESFGQIATEQFSVMYLSYCLSADQSWLLAVATDARGELLESTAINIDVPGRARRRRAPPARRLGLTKLMDFILGVMSQTAQPWRLVVGRIGRIGHGELKGWSWLLSKKNLLKASSILREICSSCVLLYPNGVPSILSACLVSTEPDSSLRLMADRFTPDERFSQASMASQLHTPRDVTCTHILVFPTSATTQSQQGLFQDNPNTCQLLDEDLWPENDPDMQDDMNIEGMNDLDDILKWDPTASPEKLGGEGDEFDGGASGAGSPGRTMAGRTGGHSPYGQNDGGNRIQEEVGILLQQPLALGYLVSTAPLGAMPAWWWAACPHLRGRCPAFLKNALHLHSVAHSNDELVIHQHQSPTQHPLDSQITTDVLRYVLEGYNALSWLALDSNTHDRLSCMPLHVQVLMQLYHTASALL